MLSADRSRKQEQADRTKEKQDWSASKSCGDTDAAGRPSESTSPWRLPAAARSAATCWAGKELGRCFSPWPCTRITVEYLWPLCRDTRVTAMSCQGCKHRPNRDPVSRAWWNGGTVGRGPVCGRGRVEEPRSKAACCPKPPVLNRDWPPVGPALTALGDGHSRRQAGRDSGTRASGSPTGPFIPRRSPWESCQTSTWRS